MVIDCYNDPYSRRLSASNKRKEFEKLKKSQKFINWRKYQTNIQKNKCAYCKVNLSNKGVVTHIDHVTPLYFDGKNDFENLVLSCKRCNTKKWVANTYVVPEWIHKRKKGYELYLLKQQQKKLYENLVLEEMDRKLSLQMRNWL